MLNPNSLRSKLQRTLHLDISFGSNGAPNATSGAVFTAECEKAKVLQEARCFSSPSVQAKQCCQVITKVCFLLSSGEPLTAEEASSLFFGVTRLFQSTNEQLRRMVYLLLKELPVSTAEAFIVTSCLTKDTTSNSDLHRANAVRVLSRIADATLASQVERYLKTAIVDKSPFVASCALASALNFLNCAPDIVKRWTNEIQGCSSSRHPMVQAHALVVLQTLRTSDRMAQRKMLAELAKSSVSKSIYTECLLISYAYHSLRHEGETLIHEELFRYVESCLRHREEMVLFEASRALLNLVAKATDVQSGVCEFRGYHGICSYDFSSALTVIQILLCSPKPVIRFSAVRVLNNLSKCSPKTAIFQSLSKLSSDLEPLLTDPNRAISTLALTCLLKTGNETNVERLVKQISGFMGDVSDAFKNDVVKAVLQLALSFPNKQRTLVNFLATSLRDEGGQIIKTTTVEALITIIQRIPAAHESGLLQLCEFIEDCEYPSLCCRVLGILGAEAPSSPNPSKFIRFIYNRLILEKAVVRVAAIDALSKIASKCEALQDDILALLQGSLTDSDDEVRERAFVYTKAIENSLISRGKTITVNENAYSNAKSDSKHDPASDTPLSEISTSFDLDSLLDTNLDFSVDALCDILLTEYVVDGELVARNVDFSKIPSVYHQQHLPQSQYMSEQNISLNKHPSFGQNANSELYSGFNQGMMDGHAFSQSDSHSNANINKAAEELLYAKVGEIMSTINMDMNAVGELHHTVSGICLTEEEAEYRVELSMHVFSKGLILLQFNITNTVQAQTLEQVTINLTPLQGQSFCITADNPVDSIEYGETKAAYIVLQIAGSQKIWETGTFSALLRYIVKESGDAIGYEDDYHIEHFSISVSTYLAPKPLRKGEFQNVWNALEADGIEVVTKLSLPFKTLETATLKIIESLNMAPCDKTQCVEPSKANHCLLLNGRFIGGYQALCKVMLLMSPEHGCIMKLAVRSDHAEVANIVAQAFD